MVKFLIAFAVLLGAANALPVTLKSRYMSKVGRQEWLVNHTIVDWEPSQTAIVVVDMWDVHWYALLSVCCISPWLDAAFTPVCAHGRRVLLLLLLLLLLLPLLLAAVAAVAVVMVVAYTR